MRYGRPLTWSNLLGMVNDRIDNWATGRVLGPVALGVYAMSFRLATLPPAHALGLLAVPITVEMDFDMVRRATRPDWTS